MGMNSSAWKYIFYFHNRPGQASTFWSFDGADKGKQNGTPAAGMANILKLINRHQGTYNVCMIFDNQTKDLVAKFDKHARLVAYNPKYKQYLPDINN
jgi:hypothetical protein